MPQRAAFPGQSDRRRGDRAAATTCGATTPPIDFELIERFGLGGELRKRVHTLSGGTRQKLNAVAAYLFRPSLVILDEPSAGLDPVGESPCSSRRSSTRPATARRTLITSHVLSELEEVADDVLFLLDGRVRFSGPLEALRAATGERRLERAVGRLMAGRHVMTLAARLVASGIRGRRPSPLAARLRALLRSFSPMRSSASAERRERRAQPDQRRARPRPARERRVRHDVPLSRARVHRDDAGAAGGAAFALRRAVLAVSRFH